MLGTPELGMAARAAVLEDAIAGVALRERRPIYRQIVKPVADRALGAFLLLAAAPLLIVIAALVRVTLGPGVVYRQSRVGKGNRVFTMYKFRTMKPDRRLTHAPYRGPDRRITHKTPADPRHTRLGRALRKSSLDELPQLWNVVMGNMSLVGPRPELAELVLRHELGGHPRHMVKPGITGLWQVSPDRERPIYECLEYDVAYVSQMSFSTDLRILVATPWVVIKARGR
jgi:lipopolysaccharide/colanic/teichoic acid biosynthesis glycosyltransferase